MTTVYQVASRSEMETYRLGRSLAKLLEPSAVVLLSGPLGAGKTRFVQGIAAGLMVLGPVTSPTFALVNQYAGRLPFFHMDFYRLERRDEPLELGFDEYFYGHGITVVEWPERVDGLPPEHLRVSFSTISDNERAIAFEPHGTRYVALVAEMQRQGAVA